MCEQALPLADRGSDMKRAALRTEGGSELAPFYIYKYMSSR